MTDQETVEKKLFRVETCLRELRTLAKPDRIVDDIIEQRFVEHTLQIAIQAVLDVASHIVADEHLGEPASARELFFALERAGWLPADRAKRVALEKMAGFRNVLVHEYDGVDLAIVRDVVENHLGDLDYFVASIRTKLPPRA
jgi:uncharacterized protein YutE (UPF0331/DUF86 family)